ncbi:single-stranded DNA-binding protein [Flaviaesturariibacter amylovorans]|uniref:Single-stranded DNA-binding protein n=1 Tax=Flaviaesturariibacter amylovorans TaxID=1084520 RepID=A0ABP8HDX6_9BACT
MYALRNKVQLIGKLGRDPEIRLIDGGKKKASFTMATNESYRNAKGERVTETQWHNVVAWGKVAELTERFLLKGKEVAVEGKLVNRTYTDKQGQRKYFTEVVISEMMLLGDKSAEAEA